ncbi:MAG: dynamin family protein [Limisphaerales bacterium]
MQLIANDIAAAANKVEFVINLFATPAIKDTRDRRLESWRSSLAQVRRLLADTAKVRIAMVGTTGAGKSTLLNAVLEHELLPTGVKEPCTAFVTTVSSQPQNGWNLEISYLTREDWEAELEVLGDALCSETEEENGDDRSEANKLKRMAKAKVAAVFGLKKDDIQDGFDPRGRELPFQVERVLNRTDPEFLTFPTFAELHGHIKGLVRGESLIWPLIEQVRASGPIKNLPPGLELVDLPGLNDPNRVRVETTRRFLSSVPHIWVVFNMKRGLTDDIQGILRERGLLRRLILGGNYSALALVGTHADDVDADNAESLGILPTVTTSSQTTSWSRTRTPLSKLPQ